MKYSSHIVLTVIIVFFFLGCGTSKPQEPEKNASADQKVDLNRVLEFAEKQLTKTLTTLGDSIRYPRSTDEHGAWKTVAPEDWTSGFFPGCLWHLSDLRKDAALTVAAKRFTGGLTSQQYLTKTHDVGFIIFTSFGNGYQYTATPEYREVILQAARSLLTRYNPNVGCIKSWDGRKWVFPVIIDNMMNLELLLWASKHGGTRDMYNAAVSHATKTMKNHFRNDGSTYHVVDYDSITGRVVSRGTHQGFADESVWARGQAWAIYGFTMVYRETRKPEYLATAEKAATWYLNNLPPNNIPYWDFMLPEGTKPERDASAAAIASSALLELSALTRNRELSETFRSKGIAILKTLCTAPYFAEGTTSSGIINHSVGNHPKDSEVDVSLIYTDYYFLEALHRYKDLQ